MSRQSSSSTPLPLDRAPRQIASMFDAIAGRYDFLNHLLSAGLDQRWRVRTARSLQLTGRERVLDLCTGTGDLALAVMHDTSGAVWVIGVDFAAEMLRHGRAKLNRAELSDRIRLVRADVAGLPLANESTDAVTIAFGIRNVQEPRRVLTEMCRVVRPGGRIAILEFGTPKMPLLRSLYRWYFRLVLPCLGRIISGHQSAYTYLPASVGAFPNVPEFCELLHETGFTEIRAVPLNFGIVYLYEARRP